MPFVEINVKNEIEKAKTERNDYLRRKETAKL